MRERMFSEHKFKAAVFIGGMGGIIQEYEMFRRLQPEAAVIPVISTGGATLDVGAQVESLAPDLTEDRDYVALFHRHLDVRSEKHTSELQSLMRISYAVFCLKKQKHTILKTYNYTSTPHTH